jgi:hypothetical protein
MSSSNYHTAYLTAFEHAQSRFNQLAFDAAALETRHAALLSATKALEVIIAQRADQQSASPQNSSSLVEHSHRAPSSAPAHANVLAEPLTHTYVYQDDSPNEIQRRIDFALGR